MGTKANPGAYDCYAKLENDEPYFLLRANDPLAPRLVELWARFREEGVAAGTFAATSKEKIEEAHKVAEDMRAWYLQKLEQDAKEAVARGEKPTVPLAIPEGPTPHSAGVIRELHRRRSKANEEFEANIMRWAWESAADAKVHQLRLLRDTLVGHLWRFMSDAYNLGMRYGTPEPEPYVTTNRGGEPGPEGLVRPRPGPRPAPPPTLERSRSGISHASMAAQARTEDGNGLGWPPKGPVASAVAPTNPALLPQTAGRNAVDPTPIVKKDGDQGGKEKG